MTESEVEALRKKLSALNQPSIPSVVLSQMEQIERVYRSIGAYRVAEAMALRQQALAALQISPAYKTLQQIESGNLPVHLTAALQQQKALSEPQ